MSDIRLQFCDRLARDMTRKLEALLAGLLPPGFALEDVEQRLTCVTSQNGDQTYHYDNVPLLKVWPPEFHMSGNSHNHILRASQSYQVFTRGDGFGGKL